MDRLPFELCGYICQDLDIADLKALRLCSSKLNTASSEWLFREVVVYMNRESLDKVKQISQAIHLTRYSRILSVCCDYCPELTFGSFQARYRDLVKDLYWNQACDSVKLTQERAETLIEVEEMIDGREKARQIMQRLISLNKKPEDELQKAHRHYQNLAREAGQMQLDSSLRKVFGLLFSKCSNLMSVKVSLAFEANVFTTKHASKQFQKGLVCPRGQPLHSKLGFFVMEQVVQAVQDTESTFKSLQLTNISKSILDWGEGISSLVFGNLTELSWNFPPMDCDGSEWGRGGPAPLAFPAELKLYEALIKHLTKLRSLNLEFSHPYMATFPLADLGSIIGNHVFPNLTSVRLKGVRSKDVDLCEFLLRHANSLMIIQLEEVFLSYGRWDHLLHSLQGKLPKLIDLDLRGRLWHGMDLVWGDLRSSKDLGRQISDFIRFDNVDWPFELIIEKVESFSGSP